MSATSSRLFGFSAMVSIAVAGCSPPPLPAAPVPPTVLVFTLRPRPVPIVTELPGRVAAFRVADVRPQVNGIILKRLFVEGSEVSAGQQLYQIDPAPYQANYDSAMATARTADALAQRYKLLMAANAISHQDYDNAIGSDQQARAAVELAHINLIYTKMFSPISGRIGRSAATEGALVTANQPTALATVQQLDTVYVDVTQPSGTLLRLKREAAAGLLEQNTSGEATVRLRLEDGSDYAETGTLQFSEVTVDEGTGSLTLRAIFPNAQRLLLPGMFVREELEEGLRRDAILVPQQGISHNQKGDATALVVDHNNVVELRVLHSDRAIGDQWLISSGLNSGDRVVVEGIQFAVPGSKVTPEEYGSGPSGQSANPGKKD